jgi:hypothetical protein
MKIKLPRHVPPGVDYHIEIKWISTGLLIGFLYSCGFFIRFFNARNALFIWDGTKRFLDKSAVMPDFITILGRSLSGFLLLAIGVLAIIAYHYGYHYRGSKSIYLMRRLPSRWELWRRCVTLPVLAAVLCLCIAATLLFIYFGIYMISTPKACLTPEQWQKMWRVLTGALL